MAGTGGAYWVLKQKVFCLYSFGIQGLKKFIIKDYKKIIEKNSQQYWKNDNN